MTHNIKHKLRNRIFEGAAIATIMIPMASPIIAHATDTPTPVKVSSTGTKVKIDDADLQKAIADAKTAGVDLTQEKTDTQTVKSSEVASAKSKITDSYKAQISSLEVATKAQKAQGDDYNKKEAQYEKDKAAFDKQEEENKDKMVIHLRLSYNSYCFKPKMMPKLRVKSTQPMVISLITTAKIMVKRLLWFTVTVIKILRRTKMPTVFQSIGIMSS